MKEKIKSLVTAINESSKVTIVIFSVGAIHTLAMLWFDVTFWGKIAGTLWVIIFLIAVIVNETSITIEDVEKEKQHGIEVFRFELILDLPLDDLPPYQRTEIIEFIENFNPRR